MLKPKTTKVIFESIAFLFTVMMLMIAFPPA